MDISVGVIAYNEENNIANLLDSLLKQSARIKEIVVVSSGSTDKTNEIVKEFIAKSWEEHIKTKNQR